jgi:nicotinic acid phosphoribosyltransferase
METFKIEVKETLSRIIEIEASSEDEAFSKIQELYNKEEIVLDSDDYIETEFLKSEE